MNEVIGDIIPLGVAVALSPIPVIAVLLLVIAPAGVAGGLMFLFARILSFAVLLAIFTWAADLIDDSAESTIPAAVLRLLLGAGLVGFAFVKFRGRPRSDDDEPELPGWMRAIDGMGAAAAFRLGVILTVANPKEIAFAAGAGLTLGGAMLGVGGLIVGGTVFIACACASVAVPVVGVLVAGERITPWLSAARDWLTRNNAIVMAIVLLVLGAMLIGSGISGLG